MQVREYLECKVTAHREDIKELTEILGGLDDEVGSLEADSIQFYLYGRWLTLRDVSHKNLGATLATITDQSLRFKAKTWDSTRTATFRDVGPFHRVDLDRPNPKCRKVRVLRPSQELVMEVCGDIPEGYELLEELGDV